MGHSLSLECDYRLEGDSLYSLKWYRDDREFFRYIPQGDHSNPDDNPNQLQLFHFLRYQMQEKMFLHLWMFIKIFELHIYADEWPNDPIKTLNSFPLGSESPPVTIFLLHGISVSDASSPTRWVPAWQLSKSLNSWVWCGFLCWSSSWRLRPHIPYLRQQRNIV